MASENDVPWPAIVQLPRTIAFQAHRLIGKQQVEDAENLLQSKVFAVEKIDGTNLGIDLDGTRFGRRQVITTPTYQRCSLDFASQVRVADVLEELRSAADLDGAPTPTGFRLYGELGCNKGLYNYSDKGFAGSWRCFGAVLHFRSEAADGEATAAQVIASHQRWAEALETAGFTIFKRKRESAKEDSDEDGGSAEEDSNALLIIIPSSPALFAILDKCEVPHPPAVFHGTMLDLILSQKEWMTSGAGEGLVVTNLESPTRLPVLLKWKQGHEPQPKDIQDVTKFLATHGLVVTASVSEAFKHLHQVSTTTREPNAEPVALPKPRLAELEAEVVEEAIRSAATKFDNPEAYFAKAESTKTARTEVTALYLAEVLSDLGDQVATPGARNQVKAAINRYIGSAYGEWRRQAANALAATEE